MLNRLVVGTANWGRDYNGHCVDEKEQGLIMEYMKEVGIEWLDVATAYGTERIGNGEFKRIVKVQEDDAIVNVGKHDYIIAHNTSSFVAIKRFMGDSHRVGISSYLDYADIELINKSNDVGILEVPYSIMDGRLNQVIFGGRIIARSIFCKGKALKYFSPRECIDFVLMNPRINKVILGVDSVDQLKENIAHLVKMETFTHNEETDTRKF